MTFQPPPSEEAHQSAEQSAATPEAPVDLVAAVKAVDLWDWVLLAIGLATLIFSCFDFYHFTSNYAGDKGFSAWHSIAGGGFFGWFGVILPVMGSVVLALSLFESQANFTMDPRLISLYAWGAGVVSELLAIVLHPKFYKDTFASVDPSFPAQHRELGHGFSFWVILALTVLGTVVALMRAQQTHAALPTPLKNLPKVGR